MSDTEQIRKVAADVMRENATKAFTVTCAACGKRHTRNLRWLQTRRYSCPDCGGQLDNAPLYQLTLAAMRRLKGAGKPPRQRAAKSARPVSSQPPAAANEYQLVLQFRGDSLADFDAMVALEEELTEQLGDTADVDGHDAGAGEMNIFIFTSDPVATFQRAKAVLRRRRRLSAVTAAYRPVDGEDYIVIWPAGSRKEFVIA